MKHKSGKKTSLPFSISQNYLTSTAITKRLLQRTSITSEDYVIEIGAGKGHITRQLAKTCRLVEAYEIDDLLYQYLQNHLGNTDNIILKHQDFLKARLPAKGAYKIFSNIPFSITSLIMHKLTSTKNMPQETWLVMEKGAAKRFLGSPRETSDSLLLRPYFNTDIVWHFSRQDFHPMPAVDIVLFHMVQKDVFDISIAERQAYVKFVKDGFRYGVERLLTKKQISTALKQAGLPCIERSGEILYVQWLCLFRCYNHFNRIK